MNAKKQKALRRLVRQWQGSPGLHQPGVTQAIARLEVEERALVRTIEKEKGRRERKERNDNR